jgi:hypothetical protein
MPQTKSTASQRIDAFDYLRGFFIVVIVIDHLWSFPSLWTFLTGEARLWMTAAEGFVLISGFLIGFIRGRKGLKLPFRDIAKKLFSRAAILYVWMIIATFVFAAIAWYLKIVPYVPTPDAKKGDWWGLFVDTATLHKPAVWIFFLAYYAIFLALSVGFIWLLRRRLWWVAALLSIATYIFGYVGDIGWMKWQLIFFAPALVGFYFPQLQRWWSHRAPARRQTMRRVIYGISIALLGLSIACVFVPAIAKSPFGATLNRLFDHDNFGILRIMIAGLWFVALAFLFDWLAPRLKNPLGRLVHYVGTHSLTAYICHGLIICLLNTIVTRLVVPENWFTNTILGALCVVLVYWFIRLPFVARIVPR